MNKIAHFIVRVKYERVWFGLPFAFLEAVNALEV